MGVDFSVQKGVNYIKLADFEVKSGRYHHSRSERSGGEGSSIGALEVGFLKVSTGIDSGLILDKVPSLV